MLTELTKHVLNPIVAHCEREYPQEAVGLLFGQDDEIWSVVPVTNIHPEPRRAYRVAPEEMVKAIRAASGDLIGVYHSHPDQPVRFSTIDRLDAHSGLLYVVVGVNQGLYGGYELWKPT